MGRPPLTAELYARKPDPVEAFRYGYASPPEWFYDAIRKRTTCGTLPVQPRLDPQSLRTGDWVVLDNDGKTSIVAADLFPLIYEAWTDAPAEGSRILWPAAACVAIVALALFALTLP